MKSHSHAQEGLESGVTTPHNEVIVQELKTLRLKIEAQKAKINAEPLQKKRIQLARTLVRLQDEEQDLLQQLGQGEEITVVEEPAPRAAVLEPESPTEEPAVVDDRGLVPSELIPPAIFVENPPVVAETPLAELVDGASAPAPEVMTGEPTDLINMAMIESLAPEDTDTPADRKSKIELLEVVRGKLRAVRTQLVSKTKAEAAGELDRWQRTIDLLKPINEHLDALQALSKPGYTPGKASHTHHPHPTPYHTEPRIHPGHQNAPYNPPHHAESAANRRIKILPNITKLTKMVLGNTELESATDTEQTLREKLDTLEESLRRFNTIMAKVGDEATAAANKNTRYRNDLLDKMTELEDRKKELETALKAKKKADPKPRQKKKFTLIEKIAPLASIEALKADILDDVITLQDNEASLETMLEALSTELQSLGNKVYAEQSDKGALYTALQERIKIVQTAHNLVSDLIEAKSSDEGRLANGIGPTQEIIGSHPIFPSVEYMADVQGIVDDVEFSATDSLETLKDCRTRLAEQRSILKTSQEEMKTQKNAVENNIATRWYFVTHELAHIQKRLIELNDLIYEKEGEEVDENPKTAEFLDEVRGSRAPYGNRFEDLMMVIGQDMRSVSPEILDGLVQASHEELEGLFEVVNEGGDDHLDALLKLRDKKNQHYFRYYLQVVWQKAEALKRSINRKNSIRNLPGFISLKTQINRLARMCKENSIPLMQNSADYEMDKSEKRAKEAADQAAALAAAGGTPTPVPIPGTTPPTPPVQPPTPNPIPTPRPRTMTLEDLIIMPAVMPIEIESDIQFNQWYASIQSRYDAVGYPFDATISRPLEAWYEQYKSYEPTLDRARGFLNNGSLDVALGITKKLEPGQTTEQRKKKEVLDAGSIGILRDQAFERLQYEIFMKGEAGQRRLEEIFTSIEQARQNNETITALEAKLKAQEKILALRKGMKVGAEEAVVVVEDNPEEFKSNNVNYIRRFVEDMKHNFRFYAAAAPTMISDGAKDKIFDRYYAAHGGVETEGKKLGFFSRLGTRLLNRVGKILPIGRAAARAGEILTGAEMTKRQEEKNRFWAIMEILKKNKLIPTQVGSKFSAGAITQAEEGVRLLERYLENTFDGGRTPMSVEDETKGKAMFEALYKTYTDGVIQTMEYQKRVKKAVKRNTKMVEGDRQFIEMLKADVSANEDWVSRAMGYESPETVGEVKREVFNFTADTIVARMNTLRITDKVPELREARDKIDLVEQEWVRLLATVDDRDAAVAAKIVAVEPVIARKKQELAVMTLRKGVIDAKTGVSNTGAAAIAQKYWTEAATNPRLTRNQKLERGLAITTELNNLIARGVGQPLTQRNMREAHRRIAEEMVLVA